MEHVRWSSRPRLRNPVIIAAFGGWNDAGEAATTAARHLADVWATRPFASIDAEEFYDFSSTRPHVRLVDGMHREIVWPSNELSASSVLGSDLDVVVLLGTEPQLRWRTFCAEVLEIATEINARMLITLGALLAEVPHSRPVSVIGTGADPTLIDRYNLQRSRYEGPTGIVGALHDACNTSGLPSLSLWAAVPAYVQGAPSPKAALALVERASQLLAVPIETTELEIAAASYERQVSELVSGDTETTEYVEQLERRFDDEDHNPFGDDEESLVDEVERFLRDQRD